MSILDDAIREHLELKRPNGADDAEVKRLEDEAFGPPQRPDQADPFAEAPTEFLTTPEEGAAAEPEIADEHERSGRRPDIADLQEAPGPSFFDADAAPEALSDEHSPAPDAPPPSPTDAAEVPLPPPPGEGPVADLAPPADETAAPPTDETAAPPTDETAAPPSDATLAPPTDEAPAPPTDEEFAVPATEEHPAGEHEAVAEAGRGAEDRHAIPDQPTQMFDVQAHVDAEAAEVPATGEQASPTDEELVDAAQEEPQGPPPAPEGA